MNDEAKPSDFDEDERILAQLSDPVDVEAFSNLMDNAHREGVSAADFIRQEPKRTSRRAIRKLCLKDKRRSVRALVRSVMDSLWDRPAEDPAGAYMNTMFTAQPPRSGGASPDADRPPGTNGASG